MIFNYCIYGDVLSSYVGPISITVYNNSLTKIFSKTIQIDTTVDSEYQFNLGDRDLFGINHNLISGSTAVITVDSIPNKYYFLPISVSTHDLMQVSHILKFDIDLNVNNIPTNTTSEDSKELLETVRILTDKIILDVVDTNMYSYFEVSDINNDIVYNDNIMNWVPRVTGNYNILIRQYNSSEINVPTNESGISETIVNIDILENYVETNSIDYVFYSKRNKIIKIEVPDYVINTVLLTNGFYIENNKIFGKLPSLNDVELIYSRGKIIIKPQIGDILDY